MRDQSARPGQAAGPARASGPPPPGTGVAARRERWARLRRSLWQPPRPHSEQPRERVVGPLELFYDLAVVVLVAQAAHRLAGHLTWPGLGEFAVIFTLVWIAWANGSLHHELHGHEDARARSTFLLQILVLAAMGAFIPQAGGRADHLRHAHRAVRGIHHHRARRNLHRCRRRTIQRASQRAHRARPP
jgi:low temperature requirement protein LtrA